MPVIWLLDAYRAGERGQVRALVDALVDAPGWEFETRALEYRKHVVLPHVLGTASVRGVTRASRARLAAPWPDVVITSGVRNEPVCRWIREQSGGKTRYVHVGRPWGPLDSFDLVVTTPQYRVPEHPNVLNNLLTLHSVTPEKLRRAKDEWAQTFEPLPAPRVAVIVGGDSGPFTFGPLAGARLGREASQMVQQRGGSLLVTSSARSRPAAVDALEQAITVPNAFYRYSAGDDANPYLGILAWADRLLVTGDSIAMLSEACATGKPVMMFDLGGMRAGSEGVARDFRLGGALYGILMRWFWQRLSRDITLVHKRLRAVGSAVWTDEMLTTARVPGESDLDRAVRAVRALLGEV